MAADPVVGRKLWEEAGNLIELMDLGYMYYVLGWLGPLGGWLFRRGMYREYYKESRSASSMPAR